jgi:hypothetical protein
MRSLKLLIPTTAFATAFAAVVACSTTSDDTSSRTARERSRQTVEPGNPSCADLGLGTMSKKLEPVADGTFSLDGGSVTISNTTETSFDFTSTVGIDALIVKGGTSANVFTFDPEATSGTGLTAPENKGLSHIEFCFDEDADAGQDAGTDAGQDAGEDAGEDGGSTSSSSSGGSTSSSGGSTSSSGGSTSSSGGSTSSSGGGRTW